MLDKINHFVNRWLVRLKVHRRTSAHGVNFGVPIDSFLSTKIRHFYSECKNSESDGSFESENLEVCNVLFVL